MQHARGVLGAQHRVGQVRGIGARFRPRGLDGGGRHAAGIHALLLGGVAHDAGAPVGEMPVEDRAEPMALVAVRRLAEHRVAQRRQLAGCGIGALDRIGARPPQ